MVNNYYVNNNNDNHKMINLLRLIKLNGVDRGSLTSVMIGKCKLVQNCERIKVRD